MPPRESGRISVVIPFRNEARNLPPLVAALRKEILSGAVGEVVWVDHGSTDSSATIAARLGFPVIRESEAGIAAPLIRGVRSARHRLVATLDADCVPERGWAEAMAHALKKADIVVGETTSLLSAAPSRWERAADRIFRSHSQRAAHAASSPLPWGPTCNLGFLKEWVHRSGGLHPKAAGAFDVDFCWRAVLSGAHLLWCPEARVKHRRRETAQGLGEQFLRYGASLPWLAERYRLVLGVPQESPMEQAIQAGARVLRQEESETGLAALAYACGAWRSNAPLPKPLSPSRFPRPGSWLDLRGRRVSIVAGRGLVRYSRR